MEIRVGRAQDESTEIKVKHDDGREELGEKAN
jgi:hypothetical protein